MPVEGAAGNDGGAGSGSGGGASSPVRGGAAKSKKKAAAIAWPPMNASTPSRGGRDHRPAGGKPKRARLGTDEYNRMEHGAQKGHAAGAYNPRGHLSARQAYWHFMSLVLGLGTLTVPYALASLGWAGLALLGVLALMSTYTGILLCRCVDFVPPERRVKKRTPGKGSAGGGDGPSDSDGPRSGSGSGAGGAGKSVLNTYPDIGAAAFGEQGRALVSFVLYVDLVASSALFLVFIATNLARQNNPPKLHSCFACSPCH